MDLDPPQYSAPHAAETSAGYVEMACKQARQILDLKSHALGHARILYGSEARKFFDIIDAPVGPGKHVAALVCSLEGESKTLRMHYADCPVAATHDLVQGLKKDTGALYCKIGTGDQVSGQQGYTNFDGTFQLDEMKQPWRPMGPNDNTQTLRRTPIAPSSMVRGNYNKRPRHSMEREKEGEVSERSLPSQTNGKRNFLDYGEDSTEL